LLARITDDITISPGRGVLGTAREVASKYPSQILDLSYRKRQLEFRRTQISQWLQNEVELLRSEVASYKTDESSNEYLSQRLAAIESEAKRQEKEALGTFGMLNGADPTIAPLRRALAVWGLSIDDIGVASVRDLHLFLELMNLPMNGRLTLDSNIFIVPWNFDRCQRQE
jgi:3-oxoacyl-(acyl-carrier-protein) synthase